MKFEKSMKIANIRRTICEVIREANDMLNVGNYGKEEMRDKIKEIHDMAKRMSKKLFEYKKDWDIQEYKKNPDYELDVEKRKDA